MLDSVLPAVHRLAPAHPSAATAANRAVRKLISQAVVDNLPPTGTPPSGMADLRTFLLQHVSLQGTDGDLLRREASGTLKTTPQAVDAQLEALIGEGVLERSAELFRFAPRGHHDFEVAPLEGAAEDQVWEREVARFLPSSLSRTVKEILFYSFTELMNNAIDHSEGTSAQVRVELTTGFVTFEIKDNGVGVFAKIARSVGLPDERYAILELAKGKMTTAASRHSGEGIFFTSRVADSFALSSGACTLMTESGDDFLLEQKVPHEIGTIARMAVRLDHTRTIQQVFEEFQDDDLGFSKTKVPVSLAVIGEENLVSRSQAKRLLSRFDRFREVILDFHQVETIGQAFADEVFRVFASQHPEIHLTAQRANDAITRMIRRATGPSALPTS